MVSPRAQLAGRSLPALALLLGAFLWLGRHVRLGCTLTPSASGGANQGSASAALSDALDVIEALRQQVDSGTVIAGFGDRCQELVSKAMHQAGQAGQEMETTLDRILYALFLRQAATLREEIANKFDGASAQADALEQADQQLVAAVQPLLRRGSRWNLEPERAALRMQLEASLRRGAAIDEERARAARLQQVTINVIGKLQEQMEQLVQKVQGMRGGSTSPWIFSTAYRVPHTPLQLAGRYEQGRANVELSLTPDKNPSDSDASINGAGPANIGVSFNLGI